MALASELQERGLRVERQKQVPVVYKGHVVGEPYRLDLLVDDKVVIECKATEKDNPIFKAQLLTYLRLSNLKLGILANFGKTRVVDGWERVVNGL